MRILTGLREPVFYFIKVSIARRKTREDFLFGLEHTELFNHRKRKGKCKMSIPNLPVNFKDDILASSNTKRKYQQTFNTDGSVSLEDVTQYTQNGSEFGASQVNQTNGAVNNIYDERILTLEELALVTEPGYFVDAMAVSDLNGNKIDKYNMNVSNEVLTGETLASRPVYQRLVDIGALPNNTSKTINTGITDAYYFWIDPTYSLVTSSGASYPLPYVDPENVANSIAARLIAHGQQVVITTNANWSTYTGFVAVKYTKQ